MIFTVLLGSRIFLAECKTLISVCYGRKNGAGQVIFIAGMWKISSFRGRMGRRMKFAVITSSGTRFVPDG
jgi:hypothetical protein